MPLISKSSGLKLHSSGDRVETRSGLKGIVMRVDDVNDAYQIDSGNPWTEIPVQFRDGTSTVERRYDSNKFIRSRWIKHAEIL